jgi:4-hydroxy-2-oxoheptanedioate aldolase
VTAIPRLNGVIAALEGGRPAFLSFAKPAAEEAIALGTSAFDGLVFEMEHNAFDGPALRDAFQYLLNRRRMIEGASLAPTVTPMVRIPANGPEMNQWMAKQVLDIGAYGVVWPHVSTVEQAINAVASCRYPRPPEAACIFPRGHRGDGPTTCSRYWGLSAQEYYARADVWPLVPSGEILSILMIEDVEGVDNLQDILAEVPGIGAILIGEGDLSQELGVPRQYDNPILREAMATILARGKEAGVVVGHPHVTSGNVQRVLEEGYRILIATPARSYAALEAGRGLAGL